MLSQKARLSSYDEFKNSTADALAWPSKVQIIKIGSRQSVQPPVSAPRVSDRDLTERWLALPPTGAICV
jgi:hypothetical protein